MDETRGTETDRDVQIDLIAVLVAVIAGTPSVLTIGGGDKLPSGPFELGHRSLQSGLRAWVERQTGHPLGYIEQLYTFADRDRFGRGAGRAISISYLGLTRPEEVDGSAESRWTPWYAHFPWEDHRAGLPAVLAEKIEPGLKKWAASGGDGQAQVARWQRASSIFGFDDRSWNEELVLQRYELLYEAGLVAEAHRSHGPQAGDAPGKPMFADHRRILATALARLRTKIKYRPVVFELMPPVFTLLQLQRTVEALSGRLAHKQNFRRLIEQQELVEETGETASDTGGRPAKLFRFRPSIHMERTLMGTRVPITRS
ncbi:hypothetical protein [Nitratireductor sp. ZSWI3]|uniref:NUDIX hydrolase n=1 Tax=Nitratireductor sp. ZSWI3 TaxID=2966359 RepID=UPI00214F91BF|nr:hypothetical protein [Nitratireductor sp. ZSWI3]MCR4264632.1 hypothetical protein [Nitratireductor sp. ZSWI3]